MTARRYATKQATGEAYKNGKCEFEFAFKHKCEWPKGSSFPEPFRTPTAAFPRLQNCRLPFRETCCSGQGNDWLNRLLACVRLATLKTRSCACSVASPSVRVSWGKWRPRFKCVPEGTDVIVEILTFYKFMGPTLKAFHKLDGSASINELDHL